MSHAAGHTLAVCADLELSCDVEIVAERGERIWQDMLGADRHAAARELAKRSGESFDASATRLWGAVECVRKLGLSRETPITLADPLDVSALRLRVGGFEALSLLSQVAGADRPLVFTLLARNGDAGV